MCVNCNVHNYVCVDAILHVSTYLTLKSMVAAVVFACYLRSDTRVRLCAYVQSYWQGCRLGLVPLGL